MRLALAGDTMLGREVAERMKVRPPSSFVAPEVVDVVREADLFLLNLECCIAAGGRRWPDPSKPFFFRALPRATELLAHLGVACVTLANNHALDYGEEGLLETLEHLAGAGIAWVGAGPDKRTAESAAVLEAGGFRLAIIGAADHPRSFAAGETRPGIAFARLDREPSAWLVEAISRAEADADAVLVTPHWGPNMAAEPIARIRAAAASLVDAGATLVAGHSAHVVHGVRGRVLYDLGDFLDDYAVDPELRNDLGLLFLVDLDAGGVRRIEAVPLELDLCFTRLAGAEDAGWISRRFRAACQALGVDVQEEDGRLVVTLT